MVSPLKSIAEEEALTITYGVSLLAKRRHDDPKHHGTRGDSDNGNYISCRQYLGIPDDGPG